MARTSLFPKYEFLTAKTQVTDQIFIETKYSFCHMTYLFSYIRYWFARCFKIFLVHKKYIYKKKKTYHKYK